MQKKNRIFGTFCIYFICMALFCGMRILSEMGKFNGIDSPELRSVVTTLIIQIGIMFLLPLLLCCIFFRKKPKEVFKHNEYKTIGFKAIMVCFALGILIYMLNVAISAVGNGIIQSFGYKSYTTSEASTMSPVGLFFLELFLVAFLPAICEEFLHRGILLQGIRSIGYKKAIIISGILFGLIHFSITQTIYATVIGILLGFVAIASKSIFPAIIIHFTNNAISLYISFASTYNWFGGKTLNYISSALVSSNPAVTFIACFLFLSIVCACIVFLIYLLYKLTTLKYIQKEMDAKIRENKYGDGKSISLTGVKKVVEIVETSYTLNLYTPPIESPIDMMLPNQTNIYKSNFIDKVFFYGSLMLGILVTLFTFIWGLV